MKGIGIVAILLVGMGAAAASASAQRTDMTENRLQRARDGNIAIQEELDAARCAGTIEAYDVFIARHPGHPLARIAAEERRRLAERPRH